MGKASIDALLWAVEIIYSIYQNLSRNLSFYVTIAQLTELCRCDLKEPQKWIFCNLEMIPVNEDDGKTDLIWWTVYTRS